MATHPKSDIFATWMRAARLLDLRRALVREHLLRRNMCNNLVSPWLPDLPDDADREAFERGYLCTPPFDDSNRRRRQTPNSPPVPKDDTQPPAGTLAIGGAP